MRIKLILLFLAAVSTSFGAAILTITTPNVPVPVGSFFFANVEIVDVTDLYAWQTDVDYELPSQLFPVVADLDVLTILEGPFLGVAGPTFFAAGTDDPSAGKISFNTGSLLGPGPGQSGSGTLFTVVFIANTAGPSVLSLSNVLFLDSNFNDIPVVVVPGFVNVVDIAPVPEASSFLLTLAPILALVWMGRRREAEQA
jgi:hypothetical protein